MDFSSLGWSDTKIIVAAIILVITIVIKFFVNASILERNKKVSVKVSYPKVPLSVNYHFTRKCNYECGFCFHTAKTSHIATLDQAKLGLKKLADKGMKKLNLSGGEPFLYPEFVGEICKYCKEVLKLESVSVVSNGSKIREKFFMKYGEYLDILAISVDSFDEETNIKIGRGKGNHLPQMRRISEWCVTHNVKFKLNSVINRFNFDEDFCQNILTLAPFRWKCFQVLAVDTENKGDGAKRNVEQFLITDEEFKTFCERHEDLDCFVPESNFLMKSSYIILDEYLRFLSKGDTYGESKSILETDDIDQLLDSTDYDHQTFEDRGGVYEWTKGSCGEMDKKYDW